ncbi:MAG: hypothetical protein ABIZ91_12695 [Gemmatimonadaceae bacterium]
MASDREIPDRGYNTSDVAQQSPPPPRKGFIRRHWGKLLLLAIVGIPTSIQLIRSYAALAFTYSSGDRVGYVQKLSKKGWLCKTWEGELQISNIPGSAPILFEFTIRSDSLAHAIQQSEGHQVALQFEQHPGIPLSCFGDTEYFISGVRKVRQPSDFPLQPGLAPPADIPVPPPGAPKVRPDTGASPT